MKMSWLLPWSHRRRGQTTPSWAAVIRRSPFAGPKRSARICSRPTQDCTREVPAEPPIEKVTLSLPHHLDVSRATQHLAQELGCDGWHVGCRHDHQVVVQLTSGGAPRYGISYECSPPVEKAVFHGSRAWALTIIPLHGGDNLTTNQVAALKTGLAALHG